MRILLALIVIVTLGLGGWWIWQDGQPAQGVPAPDAPVAVDTPAATQATEAAADAAADAAAVAADVAAEAAEASEEAGVAPVSDAAAEAEAAAEAALEAADRAADAAATAASGAVAPVAQDAAQAANDAAAATEQAATAAVAATRIQSLLTPEGFDAAQVARIIDDAAIGDAQKATLKRLVETAGSNPDLLRQALDQVKAVMP
jgi:cytoskeletal protein RodZ